MEQRNGRIDRKLQPSPEVFCHYFVYRQRPEDRILTALVRKTDVIKRELGSLSQVIDVRLAEVLKQGIWRDRIDATEQAIVTADLAPDRRRAIDDELEAARLPLGDDGERQDPSEQARRDVVRRQIDTLRELVRISKDSIGLDQEHFRAAISCGLELLHAPPLTVLPGPPEEVPRHAFPPLDRADGADPTWVDTMDSLRSPRPREQKPWEWRRDAPIRPIVFEDSGRLDNDVVHLHLEHRVVRRLLGRFIAQGFVHHDLSRACLSQSSDPIPRVVLLGRLCLYGAGAARLHEEIVPITARWTDPRDRKTPLAPYARDAESRTLHLLQQSLLPHAGQEVRGVVQQNLQASAAVDMHDLLPHLEQRCVEYAADARKKLLERGEAEAKAMVQILQTQKKHIAETAAKHVRDERQMYFGFEDAPDDELRQLKANQKHWQTRLERIEQELATEPQRIRDVYDVKAQRIEPVGLVYLWPVTG